MEDVSKMIGVLVALPEERVALLRGMGPVRRSRMEELSVYTGLLQGRPVSVVEGGMGITAAERAARLLIAVVRPALLLSAGFCGAVRQGPQVADLVLCKRLFMADGEVLSERILPGSDLCAARLSAELQHRGLRTWQGSFITTAQIVSKAEIAQRLPADLPTPVLEMESAAVAQVAAAAGVPFLGVRSVSDPADEELGFTLDELTDKRLQISISRVLLACLKKPRIIPQLGRLAANSGRAGRSLAVALQQMVPLL